MIVLKDVSLSYPLPDGGRHSVLRNISLQIEAGEMVYLVGASGSGKSSLLRLLYMDAKPDEGLVRVGPFRSDLVGPRDVPYLRRALGIVFQDFQLLPDRNVFENVAFALYSVGKSNKREIRTRVLNVLTHVGLAGRQTAFPHELSGGEQQRVCIARALANEPRILLADEPTGNLDPEVADDIQRLLMGLHRDGMVVLMATHDYRLIRKNPSRTIAVAKGRLLDVDPQTMKPLGLAGGVRMKDEG